jgi:hypothetical protein
MAYKYYQSYLPVVTSPSVGLKDDLQALINDQFENGSDFYTIGEELTFGTINFTNTDVRITHVINRNTGEKLGDDFREIIFKDITHVKGMGFRYYFDDNYWITVNTDNYKFVTASSIIRRCNNVLRWIDRYGNKIQEPCIIEYAIKESANDFNSNIIIPQGQIAITTQYNNRTTTIIPNQRFLIGNPRVAYKVRGDGINNFLNQSTYDDNSVPLIKIYLDFDPKNEAMDDIINGYANAYDLNYSLSINQSNIEQSIGFTSQLTYTLTLNGDINTNAIEWISSNPSICTVNSNGNIELLSLGNATITCRMVNNNLISDSINISVVSVPVINKQNKIIPEIYSILQNESQTYIIYQYENGLPNGSEFSFAFSGASVNNYTAQIINGNQINITNKNYDVNKLTIIATNLVDGSVLNWQVQLKGLW